MRPPSGSWRTGLFPRPPRAGGVTSSPRPGRGAQGGGAPRLARELAEVEELDELVATGAVVRGRDVVDRLVQLKRLLGRQAPHELLLVPDHQRDAPLDPPPAVPRLEPRHLRSTA